jgi:hypothetical protein
MRINAASAWSRSHSWHKPIVGFRQTLHARWFRHEQNQPPSLFYVWQLFV